MKDLNELIGTLTIEAAKEDKNQAFKSVIEEIEKFYTENFMLNDWEVAILLADAEQAVLSFACPEYLVNSGMIPISATESFYSAIFRSGNPILLNNIQQQKHFSIFEAIRTPDDKIKPIWKMMGSIIKTQSEKIGVIEVSRRATNPDEAGEDFTDADLLFLQNSITKLAHLIKKVMPKNFRGKVT
jgi:hypothetical protein